MLEWLLQINKGFYNFEVETHEMNEREKKNGIFKNMALCAHSIPFIPPHGGDL